MTLPSPEERADLVRRLRHSAFLAGGDPPDSGYLTPEEVGDLREAADLIEALDAARGAANEDAVAWADFADWAVSMDMTAFHRLWHRLFCPCCHAMKGQRPPIPPPPPSPRPTDPGRDSTWGRPPR